MNGFISLSKLNVRRWTTKGSVFMNDLILNKGFDLT